MIILSIYGIVGVRELIFGIGYTHIRERAVGSLFITVIMKLSSPATDAVGHTSFRSGVTQIKPLSRR